MSSQPVSGLLTPLPHESPPRSPIAPRGSLLTPPSSSMDGTTPLPFLEHRFPSSSLPGESLSPGVPLVGGSVAASRSPSAPATARLTARSDTGEEEVVKESTLIVIWRFIIKLKRRVASLVGSLHKKSADVHRALVCRFPILSRVPAVLMQQLCVKAQKKMFQRKYTLIQQGCVSEWIYIVQMGALAVYQQSEHVLSTSGGLSTGLGPHTDSIGLGSSLALAATSKRYESLHLADVTEGDEVGLYGLLRPPTIVQVERRKKKGDAARAAKVAVHSSDSSSDEEKDRSSSPRRPRHRTRIDPSDHRGGYPQPHTVIASQPSIVYAISARLFREMLLSVPELYVELRDEMTNKYLVRLKRFESWEIQSMRLQKIRQIQQTMLDQSRMSGGGHHASDSAALRASFEYAEALVSRDTIADLFHGDKKMFTIDVLTSVDGDEGDGGGASGGGGGSNLFGGGTRGPAQDVLISQWNEKQNGTLDELGCALSSEAPHHPPPNYSYTSILAQTGALGNVAVRAPPIPYVDTRKLVGTRREYNYKASVGSPAKHHMIPSSKANNSAAALAAYASERELEQLTLMQQSSSTSLAANNDEAPTLHRSADDATPLEKVYKSFVGVHVQMSDGSYLTPEEVSYQRRLLKLHAKAARKVELQRAHEEEKFLEDLLLVSKQVREMHKKKPASIAGGGGASFHDGKLDRRTTSNTLLARKTGLSGAKSLFVATNTTAASAAPTTMGAHSPIDRPRSIVHHTPSTPGDTGFVSAAASTRPSRSTSPRALFDSDPAESMPSVAEVAPAPAPVKERNTFVSTPTTEFLENAGRTSTMDRTSTLLGPVVTDDSPRGPFVTLPAENPAYAHLPTLPSPQIRSLFSLLGEAASSGASANPALFLLNAVEHEKVNGRRFDPLPTLASEQGESGTQATTTTTTHHQHQHHSQAHDAKSKPSPSKSSLPSEKSPPRRAASVLVDLAPIVVKARPVPTVSKYDLDSPFGSNATPPSYHSLAFHSFTDDSWRGIARVPTPPLLPPTIEDPRKIAIRQGIQRAQFRVQRRTRGAVDFVEFSRVGGGGGADSRFRGVVLDSPDRRTDPNVLSLLAPGSPNKKDAAAAAAAAAATAADRTSNEADTLDEVQCDAKLSVLSMFSSHKAKEQARRQLLERRKQDQLYAESRARKKALHRSEEVRRETGIGGVGEDDDSLASLNDSFDGGLLPEVPEDETTSPFSQHATPSPSRAARSLLGLVDAPPRDHPIARAPVVAHDTFLSAHHRRVLSGFAPGVASSGVSELDATVSQIKAQQAAREHAQRLELLKKNRLKPAPGVDLETLRKQFASTNVTQPNNEALAAAHTTPLPPLEEVSTTPIAASTALVVHPTAAVPSPVSPTKHHPKLSTSLSLPTFVASSNAVDDGSGPLAHSLLDSRQSSLSNVLSLSHKTRDDLIHALPPMTASTDGKRYGKVDPSDQAIIDALTLPTHKLHAKMTDVASRLATMLQPYKRGADDMAGRGIRIPDYSESPEAQALLSSFQKGLSEHSKRRVAVKRVHTRAPSASAEEVRTHQQYASSAPAGLVAIGGSFSRPRPAPRRDLRTNAAATRAALPPELSTLPLHRITGSIGGRHRTPEGGRDGTVMTGQARGLSSSMSLPAI